MAEQEDSKKTDIPLVDNDNDKESFSCENDDSLWLSHCPYSAYYWAKKQKKRGFLCIIC
jgi:hypothetical protein